jgi:TPR repeat protein
MKFIIFIVLYVVSSFVSSANESSNKVITAAIAGKSGAAQHTEAEQIEQWRKKGDEAFARDDMMGAMTLFLKASEKGDAHSQAVLGYINLRAEEIESAVYYFQKAAAQSEPMALFELAVLYDKGLGVKKDVKKTLDLYKRSAEEKYHLAYFRLGLIYELGVLEQPVNVKTALHYFQEGVKHGDSNSLGRLIAAHKNQELGLTNNLEEIKALNLLYQTSIERAQVEVK